MQRNPEMSSSSTTRLLRLPQIIGDKKRGVPAIIPVSRSTFLAGVRSGRYPPPVRISNRSVAWKAEDIQKLLDLPYAQPLERDSKSDVESTSRARARDFGVDQTPLDLCGAKRSNCSTPCPRTREPGKRRCKFHGGQSTGPTSSEGISKVTQNLLAQNQGSNQRTSGGEFARRRFRKSRA